MRRTAVTLVLSLCMLVTACEGRSSDGDADARGEQKAEKNQGSGSHVDAAGREKDERDCSQQSLGPRGKRRDSRKFEACMAERGWPRQ
ncbi:MAG: hypothetical protein JRH10_15510 [Deltaproteobacteria bacterium]|nr:hypothetical protein [Deltaproteobacteria bacterium]MBW2447093.1 hypothetical protein [Deltaproteobacteria bacterium]